MRRVETAEPLNNYVSVTSIKYNYTLNCLYIWKALSLELAQIKRPFPIHPLLRPRNLNFIVLP